MDQKKQFQFLLYRAEAEDVSVNALVKDETIWLTQKAMAELFGIDKSGISRHIKNIFDTGELEENVVVAKIATTTQHGAISGKTQMNETTFYKVNIHQCDVLQGIDNRIALLQKYKRMISNGNCRLEKTLCSAYSLSRRGVLRIRIG